MTEAKKKSTQLTQRQSEVMCFLVDFMDESGYPPTLVEISRYFGFASPAAAKFHLLAIEKKGWIELIPNVARGMRILYTEST